jgi:hypothetical protein
LLTHRHCTQQALFFYPGPPKEVFYCYIKQWRTQEIFGGVQKIQLRIEDRENRDLGVAAPYSGVLQAAVIWYKKFHFI